MLVFHAYPCTSLYFFFYPIENYCARESLLPGAPNEMRHNESNCFFEGMFNRTIYVKTAGSYEI